jgi:hypothetical protein
MPMPEISPSKYLVQAGWSDVPHLTETTKQELRDSAEPHLRAARTEGTPSLGAGAIYPIPLEEILVDPFKVPEHWFRSYGLDVGWNRTAAVWGAHDRDTDVLYLYAEHYRAHAEPSSHVAAIKARGDWIPGVIDPAALGSGQRDGKQLIFEYQTLGLKITLAEKAAEAGIQMVWNRLATGRLLVFRSMRNWQNEYRLYHRNPEGLVVKSNDHLMDATRYLVISGIPVAMTKPLETTRSPTEMSRVMNKAGY